MHSFKVDLTIDRAIIIKCSFCKVVVVTANIDKCTKNCNSVQSSILNSH